MFIFNFFKKNKEIFLLLLILVVFSLFYFLNQKGSDQNIIKRETTLEKKKIDYDALLKEIKAKSYCVYDINKDKIIFSKNEHLQLPLASITKLMSGFVVLNVLPEDTIVRINLDDVRQEGDTGLVVGEDWKLKDLLDFSLITSSNDGMHAISSVLNSYKSSDNENTVELMNKKAKEFGMANTIFMNETGLDINTNISGAYSSTYDVNILLKNIFEDNFKLVSETSKDSENFISENKISHFASNTNISIDNIPNLLASKTGYTDLAGGNLAIIFDAGFSYPVSIVVMGSTVDDRFTDVEKLVKLTLEKLSE